MAVPIKEIRPTTTTNPEATVEELLATHHKTIGQVLEFAEVVAGSGTLELLRALLEQKHTILHILVGQFNQKGPKAAINNLELLLGLLADIPTSHLQQWAETLPKSLDAMQTAMAHDGEPMGPLALWKRLHDPNVSRAIRGILALLESLGSLAQPDGSTQDTR